MMKKWWKAAAVRAVKTLAQTAVAMLPVAATIAEVDWLTVAGTAALAAVARFRGAKFGQFLYTADTLADAEAYDARDWGADSLAPALRLCLKIASEI